MDPFSLPLTEPDAPLTIEGSLKHWGENYVALLFDKRWNGKNGVRVLRSGALQRATGRTQSSEIVIPTTEQYQSFGPSCIEFSLESLILAQDERWRRA
jgi:hypothetical protein